MRFNFTVEEMQLEFLKVSLELRLELLWPKMTHDRRLVCFSNEVQVPAVLHGRKKCNFRQSDAFMRTRNS